MTTRDPEALPETWPIFPALPRVLRDAGLQPAPQHDEDCAGILLLRHAEEAHKGRLEARTAQYPLTAGLTSLPQARGQGVGRP
jgi:hypothetical protein